MVNHSGRLLTLAVMAMFAWVNAGECSSLRDTPVVRAIQRVRPSVVNIHSQKVVSPDQGSGGKLSGMGTGIVVDERGYILTNYHVIEDVSSIRCTLVDGSTYPADIVARDPETDLALLQIRPLSPLPIMPMGRSDDLMYGETVIAIGNAFGYEHTITRGIISELHRDVRLSATQSYKDLIQTDASINPGNSGGPLINVDGEMIGLNVAIRAGAQGIGFAIPVDDVRRVLSNLLSVRTLNGTWHGIVLGDVSPGKPVTVKGTEPGSPAEHAGVQVGDKLLSIDGRRIQYPFDVERALLGKASHDEVAIRLATSEGERELRFALAAAPNRDPALGEDVIWSSIGVRLAAYDNVAELRKYSSDLRGGMLIREVRSGSPAEQAGLTPGDILVGMHQFETLTEGHVKYVLQMQRSQLIDPVAFHVVRTGRLYRGWLNIARR